MWSSFVLLLLGVASVLGDFSAVVQIQEFSVPDGTLLSGKLCDQYDLVGKKCDIALQICVEDHKHKTPTSNCSTGWRKTGVIQKNSNRVFLNLQTQYGDFYNPETYNFKGKYEGLVLKVIALDSNFGKGKDEIIDIIVSSVHFPVPSSKFQQIQHFRRGLQPTSLKWGLQVECTTGYGPDCMPKSDDLLTSTCDLKKQKLDLFLLIDGAYTAGHENYNNIKKYLNDFVTKFTFSPKDTQFSVTTYGGPALGFPLNNFKTVAELQNQIDVLAWMGGANNLWIGLSSVYGWTKEKYGFRKDAKHLLVMFTGGEIVGNDPVRYADRLRTKGLEVVAVNVGEQKSMDVLEKVVGGKKNVVKTSTDFKKFTAAADKFIKEKICALKN